MVFNRNSIRKRKIHSQTPEADQARQTAAQAKPHDLKDLQREDVAAENKPHDPEDFQEEEEDEDGEVDLPEDLSQEDDDQLKQSSSRIVLVIGRWEAFRRNCDPVDRTRRQAKQDRA